MSTSAVVSILLAYLLQAAHPHKAEARQWLKDRLSGWKERAALLVFDAAWEIAFASFSKNRLASLSTEQAIAVCSHVVEADKEMCA